MGPIAAAAAASENTFDIRSLSEAVHNIPVTVELRLAHEDPKQQGVDSDTAAAEDSDAAAAEDSDAATAEDSDAAAAAEDSDDAATHDEQDAAAVAERLHGGHHRSIEPASSPWYRRELEGSGSGSPPGSPPRGEEEDDPLLADGGGRLAAGPADSGGGEDGSTDGAPQTRWEFYRFPQLLKSLKNILV